MGTWVLKIGKKVDIIYNFMKNLKVSIVIITFKKRYKILSMAWSHSISILYHIYNDLKYHNHLLCDIGSDRCNSLANDIFNLIRECCVCCSDQLSSGYRTPIYTNLYT